MTAVKAVIAEDEPLLADELREELQRLWPALDVRAVAHDGHEALAAIETEQPQVVFLDVQMPGADGLAVARLIGDSAIVVFVTAYDRFAVQAFEEGAVDYLLKPLDPARLARTVRRLKERLAAGPPAAARRAPAGIAAAADAPAAGAAPLRWLTVQVGRELRLVTVDEVCYLRADHKYVSIVTAEGASLVATPLKDLLARLDPDTFWQIHRGTVVNVNAVRSVVRGVAGRLTLQLKERPERLEVSATFAHRFRQL